ncbi:MAG: histidine phosphatase family protein [Proteobacteria bacterium]|nr:histidine phosphatase family protein [Pseudomonadota bacterium]MDA1059446.1 histidine phosphatase family protein [Pseudomonadota bacterium]
MSRLIAVFMRHAALKHPTGLPGTNLPFPLTAAGESQASKAANRLHALADEMDCKIDDDIECAPNQGPWQTAAILAEDLEALTHRGYRAVERAELAGRSLGAGGNLKTAQLESLIADDPRFTKTPKNWLTHTDYRPPFAGAETLGATGERLGGYVRRRAEEMWPHLTGDTLKVFVSDSSALIHGAAYLDAVPAKRAPQLSLALASWALIEFRASGRCTLLSADWRKPQKADGEG